MLPRTVLLVEDNCDDVFISRRILRKAGIEKVQVAGDGQEALDLLLNSAEPLPELVIIDLRLPRISGLKVIAELRSHERTMNLPILVLTSSDDPHDREASLELGAIAYLIKSLELSDLQRVLA